MPQMARAIFPVFATSHQEAGALSLPLEPRLYDHLYEWKAAEVTLHDFQVKVIKGVMTSTCFLLCLGPPVLGNQPPCCEEAQTSSSRGTAPRGPDGGDPRPSATSQHQPPEVGLRNLQMKVENTDEHNCWFMALHFGVVSYAATEHLLSLSSPTRELVFKGGRGRWLCVVALWLLVLGGRNLYHG